jgi:hypothetical protein
MWGNGGEVSKTETFGSPRVKGVDGEESERSGQACTSTGWLKKSGRFVTCSDATSAQRHIHPPSPTSPVQVQLLPQPSRVPFSDLRLISLLSHSLHPSSPSSPLQLHQHPACIWRLVSQHLHPPSPPFAVQAEIQSGGRRAGSARASCGPVREPLEHSNCFHPQTPLSLSSSPPPHPFTTPRRYLPCWVRSCLGEAMSPPPAQPASSPLCSQLAVFGA